MMDDRRKVLELFEEHKNFVDEKVSVQVFCGPAHLV